ncbi:isochorismate synthase [Pseudonocardia sediminis]|uniref:Isochorismate synthase n=1 Tax=Pseudonocardia sediminis TaxID=1397368 RepID=A0A4Q7V2B8_PSEST|nr:chorismate-binding protein [Pseudonocardia sediminis]RZT88506.1 isochorismate synthase [Pseudonocardia sediminis]
MTAAPATTALRVRTRPIRLTGPLLDVLPADSGVLSWVREGEGIVGWGEVARFTGTGPDRFADADRWWQEFCAGLDVRDDVALPGTGAVAFASFTFADDSPGSVLVVPRVVVGRRGSRAWMTEIVPAGGPEPAPSALPAVTPVRPGGRLRYSDGRVSPSRYRTVVAEAARRMRAGELGKAVLAHDVVARAETPLDPRFLLHGLSRGYPTCWSYAVDGLVGATPELLLRLSDGLVESRVLAGTIWPGERRDQTPSTSSGTYDLGGALFGSGKDRREHAYAVDSLAASLRPLVRDLEVPAAPRVLTLPNVSHLASDVRGHLDPARPVSLLGLLGAVHPTAAVGGTPTAAAAALISEIEGMDRGRYAGPVGYLDTRGGGELGIALRCAELDGATARLFAGCGIVADSDPDVEVREAAAKMRAVREALQG